MKTHIKCWLAVLAAALCNLPIATAQVERLAYSFEGNGEEGQGENNFSFNKGYFPLSEEGNFLAQGRAGLALGDDLLAVGSIERFTIDKPLTGSLWFKPSNLNQAQSLLTRVNPQTGQGIRLGVSEAGHLQIHLSDGNGGALALSSEGVIVVDNSWHHLAFTFQAELTEIQLYINGEAQTLTTLSDTLSGDIKTAHPLIIGGDEHLLPLQGGIDEVQIIPLYFSELNMLCLFRLEPDCAYQPTTATRGPRGFTGERGPVGERGDRGPKGPEGDRGEQGDRGSRGVDGVLGPRGNKGITGPKGLQGPDGSDGLDGSDGQDGADGEQGPPGYKGNTGPEGDKGYTGKQGPQGDTGDRGNQGPKGYRGLKGRKGDVGERGDKGVRGNTGQAGTVGAPGVKGPKGVKGDKGDKGDPGRRGDKGDKGPKGIVGDRGPKGYRGDRGNKGPRGYAGCDPRNPNYSAYLCGHNRPIQLGAPVIKGGAYQESHHPVIDLSDYGIRSWAEARQWINAVGRGPQEIEKVFQQSLRKQTMKRSLKPGTESQSAPKDLRDLKDLFQLLDANSMTSGNSDQIEPTISKASTVDKSVSDKQLRSLTPKVLAPTPRLSTDERKFN